MITIIGIPGSLRRSSYNTALLHAARELTPDGAELEIASIAEIPLYNGDVEAEQGLPEAVIRLKDRIAAADGVLLATPEYNGSLPGVMKNALDWLTRPPQDIERVFRGRPVAVVGATPGRWGTRSAQTAWLPVIRAVGMLPWFGQSLFVSGAARAFDGSGALGDAEMRQRLAAFMRGFTDFVGSRPLE